MSPIVVNVEAAQSSGLSFAAIVSVLSFGVALFAAYTANSARRFTRRQHSANVKLGQFSSHSTALNQFVAQFSSLAADLARSSEANVQIDTLSENFSSRYYETTEAIGALNDALKKIDDAQIFGSDWRRLSQPLETVEADFDCVLNVQRPEADRRNAGGRIGVALSDSANQVRSRSVAFIKDMTEAK